MIRVQLCKDIDNLRWGRHLARLVAVITLHMSEISTAIGHNESGGAVVERNGEERNRDKMGEEGRGEIRFGWQHTPA